MRILKDQCEKKQDVICRRIKWLRQKREISLDICADLITKAGYPLSGRKLHRIESGVTPLQCWAFMVAYCKAVVKEPNEVFGLKGMK